MDTPCRFNAPYVASVIDKKAPVSHATQLSARPFDAAAAPLRRTVLTDRAQVIEEPGNPFPNPPISVGNLDMNNASPRSWASPSRLFWDSLTVTLPGIVIRVTTMLNDIDLATLLGGHLEIGIKKLPGGTLGLLLRAESSMFKGHASTCTDDNHWGPQWFFRELIYIPALLRSCWLCWHWRSTAALRSPARTFRRTPYGEAFEQSFSAWRVLGRHVPAP